MRSFDAIDFAGMRRIITSMPITSITTLSTLAAKDTC